MPRARPKRLGSTSAADVSPRKLRRSKEVEDLVVMGGTTVPFTTEERKFSLQDMRDETATITLSGIENYFLQGKVAQMNRGRAKRTKAKPIAHMADTNLCEEADESDEEENVTGTGFSHCDLGLLRDYLNNEDAKSKNKERFKKLTKDFKWWTFCLAGGFNILLYGVGSKRALLDEFRRTHLSAFRTISIDGFKEDVTAKSILTHIVDFMKLKDCEATDVISSPGCRSAYVGAKWRSPVEWAKHIASTLERSKQQLIILLNNIDGPSVRDPSGQAVLAELAGSPAVLMVATVDHINATLLHTSHQLQSFNWVYYRVDTFIFSWQEILAGQSALLGLNPKSNQSTHSLSSLDVLWQSLASNSRSILRIFYAMFFENKEAVAFWDLFSAAKDEFLVSSDAALRQQLVEFSDHRILRWKRGEDGNEQLVGCLDRNLVEKFFSEKG
ncbi:Origin recognition complex subunit 2, partial [Trichostrongylus colubriformis]